MHYSEAKNVTAKEGVQTTFHQEIEVMNRADGLYIRHHFRNLSGTRQEIVWPEMSTNRACYLESAVTCSRLDENLTAFIEGDEEEQSISYVIPRTGPMDATFLFKNIFTGLHNSIPSSTYFHLTDEIGIGGQWVNGLKLVGTEKMDLVDYSFYRGQGAVKDLYWQKPEAPLLFNSDKLSVYGFNTQLNIEEYEEADSYFKELEIPHYSIVLDSGYEPINSSRFIIKELAEGERVTDAILMNHINKQFTIDPGDHLSSEFIASLLSGKPIGSNRTNELYSELVGVLSEQEMETFTTLLTKDKESLINTVLLDDVVEEVTGFKTSFFKKNENITNPLYPFLFEDPRTVYINGEESESMSVLLKDGKTLYPGIEIMRELGFEVTQNDRSLYLKSATKNYRFPLKENFYVLNERKYNVMSIPFERIADEFYFEEVSLIRIFLLDIRKSPEQVDIAPISIDVGGE